MHAVDVPAGIVITGFTLDVTKLPSMSTLLQPTPFKLPMLREDPRAIADDEG